MARILHTFAMLLACVGALATTGCANKKTEEAVAAPRQIDITAKYESITLDTLAVYSLEHDSGGEYSGVAMDTQEAEHFPKEIVDAYNLDKSGLYGVYKFQQDANVTALITRSPSMYWPSSVKIFFYDKSKDSMRGYVELAENWGDAGDVFVKNSWLYKDHDKLCAFVWDYESHDHSVDDEHDTTVEEYNRYYILDLSRYKPDTLSKDSVLLSRQFQSLHTKIK